MDYLKIVEELNEKHYDLNEEVGECFTYTSNGYSDIIEFGEIVLWHSEDEDRRWIEENNDYESIKLFLLKKLKEYGEHLVSLSSKVKL